MMYDGEDYVRKGTGSHTSKVSTGARLEPFQKDGFWFKPENQFWLKSNYSPKGIAYFENKFLKDCKPDRGPLQ